MIIYGTRNDDSVVGEVEDFCPFHGVVHPFSLIERRRRGHLYGMPLGKGEHMCYFVQDTTGRCFFVRSANPEEFAANNMHQLHADRLRLEQQLRQDPSQVPLDVRKSMAHEVVAQASIAHTHGASDGMLTAQTKRITWIWMLASLVTFVGAIALGSSALAALFLIVLFGGGLLALGIQSSIKGNYRKTVAAVPEAVFPRYALDAQSEMWVLDKARRAGFDLADDIIRRRVRGR